MHRCVYPFFESRVELKGKRAKNCSFSIGHTGLVPEVSQSCIHTSIFPAVKIIFTAWFKKKILDFLFLNVNT